MFNESSGLVDQALMESEQYATKQTDFRLKNRKLTLTQKAVRDFIVGIFNKNVEEQLKEVETEIFNHSMSQGYKKIKFDLVKDIDIKSKQGGSPTIKPV